ncbi:ATP-dependent helicase, partial [archaeon]
MHARLRYEKGTILIEGDVVVPFAIFDPRRNCYRALAFKHRDIIEFLENSGIEYDDFVLEPIPCPVFDAF